MEFSNPYWSNATKMSLLQRWIIIQSIIYYKLGDSIVSDEAFDSNSKQLVELQRSFPIDAELSRYWYLFYDFDGSTGFYLFNRLNEEDAEYHLTMACGVRRLVDNGVNHKKKRKKKATD